MAKTLFTLEGGKTVWVDENPFQIPGTDLTIWKVKIENTDGDRELYSTMSKQIATLDFTGDIEVYENDNGKVYIRKAKKEDTPQEPGSNATTTSKAWQPRDDDRIAAQWALGRSYERNGATEIAISEAQWLFNNLDRVKGSSESTNPKDSQPSSAEKKSQNLETPVTSTTTTSGNSGYDRFKARPKRTEADEDAEAQSLYASIAQGEEDYSDE